MNKSNSFLKLYDEYLLNKNSPEKCEKITKAMEKSCKNTKDEFYKGILYRCKAENKYMSEEFDDCLKFCDKAIKLLKGKPVAEALPECYNLKGIVNTLKGNYVEAINNHFNALEYCDNNNIKSLKGSVYNNIACIFSDLEQYDKAIKFLKKALNISKNQKDYNNDIKLYFIYMNLCNCYAQIDDLENLELSIKKYNTIFNYKTADLSQKIGYAFVKMIYYAKKQNPEKVKNIYNELMKVIKILDSGKIDADNTRDIIIISKWFIKKGYIEEAKGFLNIASHCLKNYGLVDFNKKYYYTMIKLYEATGEKRKKDEMVLKYYEASEILNEQLIQASIDNINNILEVYEMKRKMKLCEEKASIDELTGIYNRRAFKKVFIPKFKKACEYKKNIGIAFIDVDDLKTFNDNYGHLQGDQCIKKVAKEIKRICIDKNIIPLRYGGDEFIIIFIDKDKENIKTSLNQLQNRIYNMNMENLGSKIGRVTVSIGLIVKQAEYMEDVHEYVIAADRALYKGKKLKNTINVEESLI